MLGGGQFSMTAFGWSEPLNAIIQPRGSLRPARRQVRNDNVREGRIEWQTLPSDGK
jgi:hypothetical protein